MRRVEAKRLIMKGRQLCDAINFLQCFGFGILPIYEGGKTVGWEPARNDWPYRKHVPPGISPKKVIAVSRKMGFTDAVRHDLHFFGSMAKGPIARLISEHSKDLAAIPLNGWHLIDEIAYRCRPWLTEEQRHELYWILRKFATGKITGEMLKE